MDSERFKRVRAIFDAARELPERDRAAYLSGSCVDREGGLDAELRDEVLDLLEMDAEPDGVLGESVLGEGLDAVAWTTVPTLEIGTRIDRYELLERIGEGGMGVVYRARQTEPVQREVALKIVRLGMRSAEGLQRFEAERQTLALMDHPNIARIYDGGTAEGLPYFVMEYVPGQGLTDFAASRGLNTADRFRLILDVCAGVEHAHQKGVVHRDLKPGNILVDESGCPKILDFGVARVVGNEEWHATLRTQPGQLLGTLPYMSSEQLRGESNLVDARSDVYAIGILAYELLAGRLPIDVSGVSFTEALRRLDREPPSLGSIDPRFRGDPSTILAKALERDRDRRYPSVAAFAADVKRYLEDRPIEARPASAIYQLRKYVQRNKALVVAGIVLFLSVAISLPVSLSFAASASSKKLETELALKDLQRMISTANLHENPDGAAYTVRQILDDAAENVTTLEGFPESEAIARFAIGDAYLSRGVFDAAAVHLGRALSLQRAIGSEAEVVATTISKLAALAFAKGDLSQVEALCRGALRDLFPEGEGSRSVGKTVLMRTLSGALSHLKRYEEAEQLLSEVIADVRSRRPLDQSALAGDLGRLANLYLNAQDVEKSKAVVKEMAASMRAKAELDPETRWLCESARIRLAIRRNDLDAAEASLADSFEYLSRKFGEGHVERAGVIGLQARVAQLRKRYEEAERLYRKALSIYESAWGPDHIRLVVLLGRIAVLRRFAKDYADAKKLYERVCRIQLRFHGPKSEWVATTRGDLSRILFLDGDYEGAVREMDTAVQIRTEVFGPTHESTLQLANRYCQLLLNCARYDAATQNLRPLVRAYESVLGAEDTKTRLAVNALANAVHLSGQLVEARVMYEKLADEYRDAGHLAFSVKMQLGLAQVLHRQGELKRAEETIRGAIATSKQHSGPNHLTTWNCRKALCSILTDAGKLPEADREFKAVIRDVNHVDKTKRIKNVSRWRYGDVLVEYARCLSKLGFHEHAENYASTGLKHIKRHYKGDHAVTRGAESRLAAVREARKRSEKNK